MDNSASKDVCRLCLEKLKFKPIKFNDFFAAKCKSFLGDLENFLHIEVQPHGNTAKAICQSCYNDFEFAFAFQNQCLRIEAKLERLLGANKKPAQSLCNPNDEIANSKKVLDLDAEEKLSSPSRNDELIKHDTSIISNNIDTSKATITENAETEIAKPRFPCEKCGKTFKRKKILQRHKQLHDVNRRKYRCKLCTNTYSNIGNLFRHFRAIHRNERRFVCDKCGKSFSQRTTLTEHHASIHKDIKDIKCDACDKKFKTMTRLKTHLHKVHFQSTPSTENKNYLCSYCGKVFSYLSGFLKHQIIHTKEKPYQCKYCQAKFRYHSTYRYHIFGHLDKKPYQCKLCPMNFRSPSNLYSHHLTHSKSRAKNLKCVICDMAFVFPHSLKTHIKTHTDKEVPAI